MANNQEEKMKIMPKQGVKRGTEWQEWTPPEKWKYKSLTDPEYIKDRTEFLSLAGNGWWWGWTIEACPIKELIPLIQERLKRERAFHKSEIKLEMSRQERETELRKIRWIKAGAREGEVINCAQCGAEMVRKSIRSRHCTKSCGDRAYKAKLKLRKNIKDNPKSRLNYTI